MLSPVEARSTAHSYRYQREYVSPTFTGYEQSAQEFIELPVASTSTPASLTGSSATLVLSANGSGVLAQSHAERLHGALKTLSVKDGHSSQRSAPNTQPAGGSSSPQTFYSVSYLRGDWLRKLLLLDLGKRRIRYLLSDEVLCLGSTSAPVTSEFYSGLTFHEAYLIDSAPTDTEIYMTEAQVSWLVDEIYAALGSKDKNLRFADVDIDKSQLVHISQFNAMRKVSFRHNVATFRQKCGIPVTNAAMLREKEKNGAKQVPHIISNWTQNARVSRQPQWPSATSTAQGTASQALTSKSQFGPVSDTSPASTSMPTPVLAAMSARPVEDAALSPGGLTGPGDTTAAAAAAAAAAPTAFTTLTRAERQARLQAKRAEALRAHLQQQRASLPSHRRFYHNSRRYGGTALACDVESWTEDSDVLLELGMSWITWEPALPGARIGKASECHRHYIIRETIEYRNEEIEATRWDYSFGKSEILPQSEISRRLRDTIEQLGRLGPLVLVFHDASAETRYFQRLGIDPTGYLVEPLSGFIWENARWPGGTSGQMQEPIIIIQDTQNLYAGWSEPQVKQMNLGKACQALGMHEEAKKLHNAGNDAHATLKLWQHLLQMEPSARQENSSALDRTMIAPSDPISSPSQANVTRVGDMEDQAVVPPATRTQPSTGDLIELW